MTAIEDILPTIEHIQAELAEVFVTAPELTGNMLFSIETGAVWFEIKKYDQLSWVTADMEMRAEARETLVYAPTREDALAYDESN
jgi:hypothetical protein